MVRSIIATTASQNIDLKVWVLSAGYGLIPVIAHLLPYAASFSDGPDQVVSAFEASAWWSLVAEWKGPAPTEPRTLSKVAERAIDSSMLIAASAPYVNAILPDIVEAARVLTRKKIAVISAGFKGHSSIDSLLLKCDERFLDKAEGRGGTAHTLNAKLAAWAIDHFSEWEDDFTSLHERFSDHVSRLARREKAQHQRLTDKEVILFIREGISKGAKGRSILLRKLRGEGKACEQGRFKALYATVVASTT